VDEGPRYRTELVALETSLWNEVQKRHLSSTDRVAGFANIGKHYGE